MEPEEFVEYLGKRFGDHALHMIEFPDADKAFAFLRSLSFVTGTGQNLDFPKDLMPLGLFRPQDGSVTAIIGGNLTVEENYEIRKKATAQSSKFNSIAVGDD